MKEIKNYQILKEQFISEINAKGTLLKHIKSGAHILVIENDDENKVFSIGFRTTPKDSTGVPHIIEHSVLCGSRKYPVKEPFVELLKGSLNTFLNAMTYPDKTVYPVASCNDSDFANLMDIYMDAVCYPNIYQKEEIFKQEGWHYELTKPEDDLTINGVVYNEMKGAFSSPDSVLGRVILHSLYKDTTYGVESGGLPEDIPNLTYQAFLDFHHFYYHPANSYIYLYGNMDVVERLKWLDEAYLSHYDEIQIDSLVTSQPTPKEVIKEVVEYPITKDTPSENKTYLSYNVSIDFASNAKLWLTMEILQNALLSSNGAILKQALLDAGIGNDISGSYDGDINQPIFSVIAKNAEMSQLDDFVRIIEDTLKKVVKDGLDKRTLLSIINFYEFKYRQADFGGTPKGLIYNLNALGSWLYDKLDPFARLRTDEIFAFLKEQVETDYFEQTIQKYLLDNHHKSLVCVKPSYEVADKKEQALKNKLAEYKNTLSSDDITKIIEDTTNLKKYQSTPDSKEALDTIPMLKRSDIAVENVPLVWEEKDIKGVTTLFHDIFTNKIGYLRLLFDVKELPEELVPYLGLFIATLGEVDTENYTYPQLEEEIKLNSGGINFSLFTLDNYDKYSCYLNIRADILFDKIDFAYNMIEEIIKTSKFDNHKRLKEIIAKRASYMQRKLAGAGHAVSMIRALSYVAPSYYYDDLNSGVAFNDLLTDLLKNFDERKDELTENLKRLQTIIFEKSRLLISYTSTKEAYEQMVPYANNFIDHLYPHQTVTNPFKYQPNVLNEGFTTPFDVQFVATVGKLNHPFTGSLVVLKNIISMDYLWPEVRVKGGAYGCFADFMQGGSNYFVSYRDPNLENTLAVYHNVLNFIDSLELSEEDIFKYVIGAIGEVDRPLTPSQKGSAALTTYLQGQTNDDLRKTRQEIINCTLDDIKGLKSYVQEIFDQNLVCVIGNEKVIKKADKVFKNTRSLF